MTERTTLEIYDTFCERLMQDADGGGMVQLSIEEAAPVAAQLTVAETIKPLVDLATDPQLLVEMLLKIIETCENSAEVLKVLEK